LLLPLQIFPSGMKPEVRPLLAPARLPTANQLNSGVTPELATAAAHAGFLGWISPVEVMPSS
jgi:hypothetical protein